MALDTVKSFRNIEDKVFLVTGGAAGIGAGVVRCLLAENAAHVAFLDIAEREGSALEAELRTKFGALRAKFVHCDVSDGTQLDAAYKQILDKYRRLDAVINNAGIFNLDNNAAKNVIDVNFTATVSSTLKAVDIMGADKGGRGGLVVNLSSLLAFEQNNNFPVYAASKVAVLHFTKAMGAEHYYGKSRVRVITVCLGPTDTAMLHRNNANGFRAVTTLTLRSDASQRVESAVTGILEVISQGKTGSVWAVADDRAAVDITDHIHNSYADICQYVKKYIDSDDE